MTDGRDDSRARCVNQVPSFVRGLQTLKAEIAIDYRLQARRRESYPAPGESCREPHFKVIVPRGRHLIRSRTHSAEAHSRPEYDAT